MELFFKITHFQVGFTGANLERVILDGVIFCNTTMPDRTINNVAY
jgi:hypothetical protein